MALQYFEFAFSSEIISRERGTEDWCQERLDSVGHLGALPSCPYEKLIEHPGWAIKTNHEIPWRSYIAPHTHIYIYILYFYYMYIYIIYIYIYIMAVYPIFRHIYLDQIRPSWSSPMVFINPCGPKKRTIPRRIRSLESWFILGKSFPNGHKMLTWFQVSEIWSFTQHYGMDNHNSSSILL